MAASVADTATDLVVLLMEMKDRGIPLASVDVMIDVSDNAVRKYVAGHAEFVRDEVTGVKWLVVRPKPAGA